MKLWLLKPVEGLAKDNDPWEMPYDKTDGVVVRAECETDAREIAVEAGGDEMTIAMESPWLNPRYTTCTVIDKKGPAEVILYSYVNG